jgi:Sensor N-terminal transmembrane domain
MPLDSQQPHEDAAPAEGAATTMAEAVPATAASQVIRRLKSGADPVMDLLRTSAAQARTLAYKTYEFLLPWAKAQPLWRFCTRSLSRRIFAANLAGLIILLTGFGILTYQHTWLIDAKAESLRTQARMIAVAVASNARVDTGRMTVCQNPATI